jgi:hypothetical protein
MAEGPFSPRFIRESDAAAFLALRPRTLRRFRQQGLVPFHRFGRAVCYSLQDLVSFAESRKRTVPRTEPTSESLRRKPTQGARP